MKKNFFKKLSFVLALAMIVTALAPAAGAFAAKAPKLSATTKYLYLDVDGKNVYDFNISNKVTGWKYLWSSANEDVAEVNAKNGVTTATGAGKTTVSVVITDKDGEEFDELTATVIVRDNIKELTITNLPTDGKVAVGHAHDFNRSYVTVAKKTKGTSGITRWAVDSKDATITDMGVFTATKAGEYTITARAFQSKAKYTSWLTDATKYASYVTAEATYKVTVAASMVKAEQVDLDTLKVTFDSAVTDAATKLSVYNVIGTADVATTVSKVTMNADNTVATVDLYVPFIEEGTVVVKYPGMADVKFVAASSKVTEIKSLEITTTTAQLQKATPVAVKFLNKDGVNIATNDAYARLTWESSIVSYSLDTTKTPPELMLFKVGDVTTLTATFHTYNYDTTTGQETGNLTAKMTVTCVDKVAANVGTLSAYTVASAADWNKVAHTVAAGDGSLKLFVKLVGTDANGDKLETLNLNGSPLTHDNSFTYTSSDNNVVIVGTNGDVYPVKAGSAVIVVKHGDKNVGTVQVTVTEGRKLASFTLSTQNIVLSNDADVADSKSVTMTVKDQLEGTYAGYTINTSKTSAAADGGLLATAANASTITFNASGVPAGTYYYTVKLTDSTDTNVSFSKLISVTVKAPVDQDVYYYALESDNSSYDMKIASSDTSALEDVTLSLYAYAKNGVRNDKIAITGSLVTVTGPDNATYTVTGGGLVASGKDAILSLVTPGTPVAKLATGTYKVAAVSGTQINTATYFVVTDTQAKPVLSVNKTYSKTADAADLVAAVNECFNFTVDGTDLQVSAIGKITYTGTGNLAFIKDVKVTQTFAGSSTSIEFTVPVNVTINWGN